MAVERKALLVAAGMGSRLRPMTDVLPKCLIPIGGRPLLGIWLERLQAAGFSKVVVNLHHHADLVREYVRRSPYAALVTLTHETELLGTGGTLLANRSLLAGGPLLFAHADNLTRFDPGQLLAAHAGRPPLAALTMMTFRTDAPRDSGIVECDSSGIVIGFHEKVAAPPGDIANAAVYVVEPEVFGFLESLRKDRIDFSTEVLPHFLGRIFTFHNEKYHRDIGTPERLAMAEREYRFDGEGAGTTNDPWYGLMRESGGLLAREFARAMERTYASAG